jgi:hypothetical protein
MSNGAIEGNGAMEYSNSEALAVLKWMVRTRLMETMFEPEPRKTFYCQMEDDFAEMMEAGVITSAEVTQGDDGIVSVRLQRDGDSFVFGAAVVDGRIEIERRAQCS